MGLTVVMADDDAAFRSIVKRLLGESVKLVAETASGEETVERVLELRPDLVLMSIALPGLNAITATRRIRAALPAVRVVMLTVQNEEAYLSATGKAGVDAFLPKRLVRSELLATLREAAGILWPWGRHDRRHRRARPMDVPSWDGS